MSTKGLLFIPDISGFSRYVHQTEIEHSRLIIQELLETLIDSNRIGLEISEIEGDAILFYRSGELPDLADLSRQVEEMFCAFQRNILSYDLRRYCQCKACEGVRDLTLKVITHYGEFTGYNVKDFRKLFGKDVIVVHELLKNDIEQHEYWLVTEEIAKRGHIDGLAPWAEWRPGAKDTQAGPVPFSYTQLGRLKETVGPESVPPIDLANRARVISATREFDTDIITLFHATGDFNYRSRWQDGVMSVEEVDHLLPRVGMRCRCILASGQTMTYASSYRYRPDRVEFTETEEATGGVMRFLLEAVETKLTRLTLEYYIPRSITGEIAFRLLRKSPMERSIESSMSNLATLVKELRIPTAIEA